MLRTQIHKTLLAAAIAASFGVAHAGDAPTSTADAPAATADAPQSTDATTSAQKKPATSGTEASSQNAVNLSGVVVTPLRESLQSAQSIKQDSRMIVDSIVAEDIGKLPDNSVADAMQRITGVQVAQGFQGETNSVVIRGLPNVITTLNGREIFSGVGVNSPSRICRPPP